MLDHVSISHQSGLILYQKSFTPTFNQLPPAQSPINALFRDAMIEGKVTEEKGYEKDGFSVRWTVENGLGLVFVVVFPALLPLTYIQDFLARMKQLYLSLFQPYLQTLVNSLSSISAAGAEVLAELKEAMQREHWERILLRCLRNCEGGSEKKQPRIAPSLSKKAQLAAAQATASGTSTPGFSDSDKSSMLTAEEIAKNVAALKDKGGGSAKGKAKGGRVLRSGSASPSPSPSRKPSSNATAKLMRKWNDSAAVSTEDMAALDFSSPADDNHVVDTDGLVSEDALGTVSKDGSYEVADWDFRRGAGAGKSSPSDDGLPSEDEILARGASRLGISAVKLDEDDEPEAEGMWASVFSRIQGKKVLSAEDLKPVLAEMEKHLMSKNVAKDIAEKLCEGVGAALAGKKLSGFSSIKSEVQTALQSSITRILTPKTSTDLLVDIRKKRSLPSSLVGDSRPDPFTITFVGVNGVGKSTNLSKVCFWLLQNKYRVLIAACDTFRSGAVEQLRVHVRNLGALGEQMGMGEDGKRIELYERGYGKDAAGIAKDAIAYAKDNDFDVVLIDTAGRMQDNEPLMRALAKLVSVNNPDKLVFVGEALVGNEAVDQLSKFDRALKDFSGPQRKRGIDGIILTKFDTIDDKVGAALSMTYVTGQPILFVGCGQTYTDLRHLRVNHITQALLSA